MRKLLAFLMLLALVGAGAWYLFYSRSAAGPANYRLATIERGAVVNAVSATGTLKAVVTVNVGSQISGQIMSLGADYNTRVTKDQVIARLNPENLEAKVRQREAELAVAVATVSQQEAAVIRAEADLKNSQAAASATSARAKNARVVVADTERDLKRQQELFEKRIVSEAQLQNAQGAYEKALANRDATVADELAQVSTVAARAAQLEMAKAEVQIAKSQVKMREAALSSDRVDLDHTFIRSPVDGVVIDRQVDVGQTVAATMQAPTLFTIAQDLGLMQVEVNVNEADIGRVNVGQRVTFTVDAFPDREFDGAVRLIRMAPQTVQNVVTYKVVVAAANPELRLMPGMTADVRVIMNERRNVLRGPNAALRFRPADESAPAAAPAAAGTPTAQGGGAGRGGQGGQGQEIEQLAKDLELTPEQQEQIRTALTALRERQQAQRAQVQNGAPGQPGAGGGQGGGVPGVAIGGGGGGQNNRGQAQNPLLQIVSAALTPEQQVKYRQLQSDRRGQATQAATRPGRVFILGAEGKPTPVAVQIGLADAAYTEIVSGLDAGARVVIGLDTTSAAQPAVGGAPRLRFGF